MEKDPEDFCGLRLGYTDATTDQVVREEREQEEGEAGNQSINRTPGVSDPACLRTYQAGGGGRPDGRPTI